MGILFSNMIGTLAVIFVIAFFIGGSDLLPMFLGMKRNWKFILTAGIVGGTVRRHHDALLKMGWKGSFR